MILTAEERRVFETIPLPQLADRCAEAYFDCDRIERKRWDTSEARARIAQIKAILTRRMVAENRTHVRASGVVWQLLEGQDGLFIYPAIGCPQEQTPC